jgi:hypothetical protein
MKLIAAYFSVFGVSDSYVLTDIHLLSGSRVKPLSVTGAGCHGRCGQKAQKRKSSHKQ